jgi:hypothetical protein
MELGFGSSLLVRFKLAAAPRSTMSSSLPYCRTNQTSSDVGMIGMIMASCPTVSREAAFIVAVLGFLAEI